MLSERLPPAHIIHQFHSDVLSSQFSSVASQLLTLTLSPHLATSQDLRGSWSVHFDPFKSIAVVRSFLYPGYFFYFKSDELTWGSMYVGTGTRNDDLIFML